MGGKLAGTSYTIDDQKITFNADALETMADYGTITIQTKGNKKKPTVNVTSDERIVYNAPMK